MSQQKRTEPKCPLCHGRGHLSEAAISELNQDHNLLHTVEEFLAKAVRERAAAVPPKSSKPEGLEFQKAVHGWSSPGNIWRRSNKE